MSFQNIVAQLLQQGMGGQTQQRLQHTASQSGGGLDQMLGALLGGNSGGGQAAPADRASDSIQFDLFEYIYHQILHKDHDWVARDLFRADFRSQASHVEQHAYEQRELGCLMLATSHEIMLENLISRPIESGDVFANANTIILMGKVREGTRMTRALHVAKHRGSACDDQIIPFEIRADGLHLQSAQT